MPGWIVQRMQRCQIDTNHISGNIELCDIGYEDTILDAGGLDRKIRIFRLPEDNPYREMKRNIRIPIHSNGDNPVWVRVTTEDGFNAWSSPMFIYHHDNNEVAEHKNMTYQIGIGPNIRKSPYFEATVTDGVQSFSVYNHMYIPAHFGQPDLEYQRLTEGVVMWDVGAQRQVEIVGPDAMTVDAIFVFPGYFQHQNRTGAVCACL